MTNLINGKEALIALANGEEVEFKDGMDKWESIKHHMNLDLSMFLTSPEWMKFRMKPKTIMLNGIAVPKPFVPKVGETYWCFSTQTVLGYGHNVYVSDYDDKRFINMGAWRTEDEIKQVVAALRSVFKTD